MIRFPRGPCGDLGLFPGKKGRWRRWFPPSCCWNAAVVATAGAAIGGHGGRSLVLQMVKAREREKALCSTTASCPPSPGCTPSPGCPPSSARTPRVAKLSLDYHLRNRRDQPPAPNPVHPRCQLLTLPPRHPQPIPHTAQKHRNQSASSLGLECKPFLWLLINPKEVRTPHGGCQAPALPNPSPTGPNTADTRTLPALSPPGPQD